MPSHGRSTIIEADILQSRPIIKATGLKLDRTLAISENIPLEIGTENTGDVLAVHP
jgi:hypothetical protein